MEQCWLKKIVAIVHAYLHMWTLIGDYSLFVAAIISKGQIQYVHTTKLLLYILIPKTQDSCLAGPPQISLNQSTKFTSPVPVEELIALTSFPL